ncbi:MAG: penicillin acylase family protein [Candidatus Thermoplasmatota archaeon]
MAVPRAVVLALAAFSILAGCMGDGGAQGGPGAGAAALVPVFDTAVPLATDDPCNPTAEALARSQQAASSAADTTRATAEQDRLRVPAALAGTPLSAVPTEATLKTDAFGVTHIYADDAYTLFYANGYVQARDRLFQIHVLRHVGYGDSATVAGSGQLPSDLAVRRDLYSRAEIVAQFDRAPAGVQDALQAYADGVNRFIAEAVANDALPGEFAALGQAPEPWTVYDSVAAIDYLIGYFGSGGGEELANARRYASLEAALGRDEAHAALGDLNWVQADDAYTSIPAADLQVNGCERPPALGDVPAEQLDLALAASGSVPWGVPNAALPGPLALGMRQGAGLMAGFKWGSNALLVAGEHTTTGLPIMFGGPQMGYYKPPVPYQVGLHGAGYDAVGIGVASAPGIVIGRTPQFAWSVTSGADDQVDTVALRLDAADPHRYEWDGAMATMDCEQVVHRSLPSAAALDDAPQVVVQEVCRAQGMPVVAWNPDVGVAWAQRSTVRGEELDGAWMWLSLARCTDLACFQGQIAHFPFTFNFHYAGPEGIAYYHTGDIPLRAPGLDPRLPALAGAANAWRGEAVGLALNTWAINPSTGYVANWNNAPARLWRTGDTLEMWGSVHRVQLLDHFVQQRLAEGTPLAWQDVADILEQAATHDPFARQIVPHLVEASEGQGMSEPLGDVLQAWADADYAWADANADGNYDHAGHAVYDDVRAQLQSLVFDDELGADAVKLEFDPPRSGDPHAGDHGRHDNRESTLVDALNGRTAHPWCDDVGTDAVETCAMQMRAALIAGQVTVVDTPAMWGGAWDGSAIHHSRFTPIGGTHADEIPMVNRGSWNQIVAIGQGLDQAQGVLPPGNSGLMTSLELGLVTAGLFPEPARVTAELGLYTGFDYKPLAVTPQEVDSVRLTTTTLIVPDRVA